MSEEEIQILKQKRNPDDTESAERAAYFPAEKIIEQRKKTNLVLRIESSLWLEGEGTGIKRSIIEMFSKSNIGAGDLKELMGLKKMKKPIMQQVKGKLSDLQNMMEFMERSTFGERQTTFERESKMRRSSRLLLKKRVDEKTGWPNEEFVKHTLTLQPSQQDYKKLDVLHQNMGQKLLLAFFQLMIEESINPAQAGERIQKIYEDAEQALQKWSKELQTPEQFRRQQMEAKRMRERERVKMQRREEQRLGVVFLDEAPQSPQESTRLGKAPQAPAPKRKSPQREAPSSTSRARSKNRPNPKGRPTHPRRRPSGKRKPTERDAGRY